MHNSSKEGQSSAMRIRKCCPKRCPRLKQYMVCHTARSPASTLMCSDLYSCSPRHSAPLPCTCNATSDLFLSHSLNSERQNPMPSELKTMNAMELKRISSLKAAMNRLAGLLEAGGAHFRSMHLSKHVPTILQNDWGISDELRSFCRCQFRPRYPVMADTVLLAI